MVPPSRSIGQVAYQEWSEAQGNLAQDKKKIPTWDKLGNDIQAAWEAGAKAAVIHAESMSNKARGEVLK